VSDGSQRGREKRRRTAPGPAEEDVAARVRPRGGRLEEHVLLEEVDPGVVRLPTGRGHVRGRGDGERVALEVGLAEAAEDVVDRALDARAEVDLHALVREEDVLSSSR
jgi:hypothetical protein